MLCGLPVVLVACGAGVTENSGAEPDLGGLQPTAATLPVDLTVESSADAEDEVEVEVSAGTSLPASASCSSDTQIIRERMLALINEARAEVRNCGNEEFEATNPVMWSQELEAAAQAHSEDMAMHNFFSHTGSDGSAISDRVTDAGYTWSTVGENIAAGRRTANETISDWLESPGHCRNLMNPDFTEVAVACVQNENSDYQRYWTNTLGSPR